MRNLPDFDEAALSQRRSCRSCEAIYTIAEQWECNSLYFAPPHDYRSGCREYCLGCWLGVGPLDIPEAYGEEGDPFAPDSFEDADDDTQLAASLSLALSGATNAPDDEGDLLARYAPFLDEGYLLAVMPIARVHLDWFPLTYRNSYTFVPAGMANLDQLNIVSTREDTRSLAEASSVASGVSAELLNQLTLVVFPCRGDWNAFRRSSHRGHLDMIRQLSESVDHACLNFIRYNLCNFEPVDELLGRAGQVASNPMMAGLCLYNHEIREARIVGGAAFTHILTRGLGLALESVETEEFPRSGEVGHLVDHALDLYANAIEAVTDTSRFVQALSLLEFLADPQKWMSFTDVSKVIARYIARDQKHYDSLRERFKQLTGKYDKIREIETGYRTRIVHIGDRLEAILPQHDQRRELFRELNLYIRQVIDHMIAHSEMTWSEYLSVRESMRPFEQ